MARRMNSTERFQAIAALVHQPATPELQAQVSAALDDSSNLVAAAAARVTKVHRLTNLLPHLLATCDRFYLDPVKTDRRCQAKFDLIDALAELGHADGSTFVRAAQHRQPEPVYGGSEDTAGRLRVRAAEALVPLGHAETHRVLVDLLADPLGEVRSAAARLLGDLGDERSWLLLRLRFLAGDPRSENLGDYLAALMAADARRSLPLVVAQLDHRDPAVVEGAALALGESRLAEALPPLVQAFERPRTPAARRILVTAIALLRNVESAAYLLHLVATADLESAEEALAGLHFHRDRPAVLARLVAVLEQRNDPHLLQVFAATKTSAPGQDSA